LAIPVRQNALEPGFAALPWARVPVRRCWWCRCGLSPFERSQRLVAAIGKTSGRTRWKAVSCCWPC